MRTSPCTAAGERKKNQESPLPPPGGFIVARAVARRRHPFPRVPHRTRPCNDSFNGNLRNSCLRTYAVGGIVRAGSSACRGDLGGVISSAPPSPHLRVRASPSPHRHRRHRHRKHCHLEPQGIDHEIPPIGPPGEIPPMGPPIGPPIGPPRLQFRGARRRREPHEADAGCRRYRRRGEEFDDGAR